MAAGECRGRPVTGLAAPRRPGARSIAMIVASIGASLAISFAMDLGIVPFGTSVPAQILLGAVMFNATCVLQAAVGAIIEWRRPGHTIGRLLMLSGPLYGFVAAGWTTAGTLEPFVDPGLYRVASWAVFVLSYPVIALIAGWVPLLFPTGTLPGPRWRVPIAVLIVLSAIGLAAMAVRPGPLAAETELQNPFGIDGWPGFVQPFVDAIALELGTLLLLAAAALIIRYRRGDRIERLQIRWLVSAVAVCAIGFIVTAVAHELGNNGPPIAQPTTLVAYAGILLMPIAIGMAVLRYRLYDIDRIISRTISYGVVTATLVAVYAGLILLLQAPLGAVTGGDTVAVAASTLVAAGLFQPLRRRIQAATDRRFNRARYDAERTAAAFAAEVRDGVDPTRAQSALLAAVDSAIGPQGVGVWIRGEGR
jgi:hypothetical protein